MQITVLVGIVIVILVLTILAIDKKSKTTARENYIKVKNNVVSFLSSYNALKEAYISHSDIWRVGSSQR